MAQIKKVEVKRFKRIANLEFELGSTTLVIGANNAGKSSILQAIHFAVSLAQSAKLVGGVNWRNDKYELSFAQTQLLYSPVSDAMTISTGGQLVEDENQRIEIGFHLDDGSSGLVTLRKGRNRNLKVALEGRQVGEQLQDLDNPFSVYAPGLAGVPRTETFQNLGRIKRTVARGDANLVLRNVLLQLSEDEQKWRVFLADMTSLFPGISISCGFQQDHDESISVTCSVEGGPVIPLDAAGTSILQASQILGYVTLFKPKLLVLDEPDSHLHPDKQRLLCETICRIAATRDFQAIMSSHSRHVLDALSPLSTVLLVTKGTATPVKDIDMTSVLLEIGALDSIDYFADGATRCVIVTEDTDTSFIETLFLSNGFSAEWTDFRSYAGCSNVDAALVLGAFLKEKAPRVRLIVHRDRDYLPQERVDNFVSRLKDSGILPFVTRFSDIEGYFLNAAHLSSIVPGITVERGNEIIQQATADQKRESIKAIVNQTTTHALWQRNRGGPQVNHGELAAKATEDYDSNPFLMRRGDVVLPRVKELVQAQAKTNLNVCRSSEHLKDADVTALYEIVFSIKDDTNQG